jgi:glycosyltransferase involved in cell wall biosynthesis
MRILQVLRAPVGGLMRHVADLSEGLAAKGHRVGLVVDGAGENSDRLTAAASHFSLGVHTIAMPRVVGPGDALAPGRLKILVADLSIDVVHGHGAKGGFHARLGVGSGPVPVFYTPHGGVLHYSPKSIPGRIFYRLERRLLARTEKIIFESAFARTAYTGAIADPGGRGIVVHNGLRPAEFEPITSGGEFAFGFVGELRKLKGVDVLFDALIRVGDKGDLPTLLVAGDGPDRLEFEARARGGNLPKSVVFCGYQPATTVFGRADCMVVPSRKESLPYIVLEAAAAGKPLIATRAGGMAEIFGATEGRLVEPGHVGALAGELERWLTSPGQLIAEATIRREHVRNRFDLGKMVDAIEALYFDGLAGR